MESTKVKPNLQKTNEELAKAMQVLAEDRARRMNACMQEIQKVLDAYGFDLTVSTPSISLVPKDPMV